MQSRNTRSRLHLKVWIVATTTAWLFALPFLLASLPFALVVTLLHFTGRAPFYLLNWLDYRAGRTDELLIRKDIHAEITRARCQDQVPNAETNKGVLVWPPLPSCN